jgi:hypothetical protein
VTETRPSLPVAAAVFAGAVVLVGLPVMVLTGTLFGELLAVFGVAEAIETTGTATALVFSSLAVLAGVTRFGLSAVLGAESRWVAALGALLALAVLAVVLRSAGQFADGYRGESDTR